MYRPKNWKRLKKLGDKELNDENYLDNVFEAGADAMLEGLKKTAYRCIPNDQSYKLTKWRHPDSAMFASKNLEFKIHPEPKGWLVLIPDEEK